YLNNYGLYNDLLYEVDAGGTGGTWTLVERNANGNETKTEISDTNKFYPPNYRTTFTALLEYRTMHLRFFHEDDNLSYDVLSGKKFGEQITLPVYNNPDKPNAHFSHWEIQVGSLKEHYGSQNPELAASLNQIKTRYESGEVLDTTNPLWYYLGTGLVPLSTTSSELVVTLELRAVHWNNTTVHQYSIRPFTDLDSGTQYIDFSNVSYSDLSLENPVSCEDSSIWLYYHPQILSYSFYDHNGVYHEIKTANLKDLNEGIAIGVETTFLGEKIYFNPNWAITISVNYQSSAENITVKFNYGADIYSLPAYNYYERPVVTSYTRKIGNSFVLLTGENYMKTDYIFTGWHLVGDDSGHVYCAGDWFTIPNFNTSNQSTVFEFEAVWYLQRLLFNFDFNGGSWENNTQPNFNSMKGAYGSHVRVVTDVPVRFGYDFVGWSLENNSYTDESELLQPGDAISVGAKFQTLYAQWTPRRLRVLFYTKNNNGQWVQASDPVSNKNTMEPLRSGDYIEMPYLSNTTWYNFNGWQIGGNGEVVAGNSVLTLTTDILSQLQTSEKKDPYTGESILEVSFYADVKKLTVSAIYDLEITTNGSDKVLINGIATDKLITELPQDDYFYDYYPFSVAKTNGSYSIFDTNGRRFIGWHYTIDGVNYEPIDATTKIPVGAKKITVSAS
ncbi:MAG: InlB B-repeat-containing protein, partial [Clostridia bacterium]|nr:InlB B-repeat-containing protein [Clostridia bacterium]